MTVPPTEPVEKLQTMSLADDVTVIFHEKNFGKGAAIRTALQYARGDMS